MGVKRAIVWTKEQKGQNCQRNLGHKGQEDFKSTKELYSQCLTNELK